MDLTETERHVLQSLVKKGSMGNVMEFLNWPSEEFDRGFEFANNLQNKDLVKLLYSNFNKNLIVVELTLVGIKHGS
ncbi:MAG: hypothetical protein UZ12_BCD005001060 [Bacteroidetes bacterium OLB12]|nr:MAG: hypothetical protein UZ12_BCD005001060 [Bacteroidetes bacterium OLB12]HNR74477.1 hypothetical protein [Cyclobacteriaceae bacterium]HNU41443.1 hypothetical protein [Cyclobacteriaceae bacterium]